MIQNSLIFLMTPYSTILDLNSISHSKMIIFSDFAHALGNHYMNSYYWILLKRSQSYQVRIKKVAFFIFCFFIILQVVKAMYKLF